VRAIFDTNIIVSALISPSGTPARLLAAWFDHRFVLVSHQLQIDELRDVTRRPMIAARFRSSNAGRLINRIRAVAEMPKALPPVSLSPDPRDDFLLALSEAAKADWLVTGDKDDLLALHRHLCTQIVTASRFAQIVGG
jgi:putative PIN family toxin of toxin-antitoxin system